MTFEGQRTVGFVNCHLMPGLDACDVAKEPFVFYGAKLPRLPPINLIHSLSLIREHDVSILIRFCLPEYALPCPAPMFSLFAVSFGACTPRCVPNELYHPVVQDRGYFRKYYGDKDLYDIESLP